MLHNKRCYDVEDIMTNAAPTKIGSDGDKTIEVIILSTTAWEKVRAELKDLYRILAAAQISVQEPGTQGPLEGALRTYKQNQTSPQTRLWRTAVRITALNDRTQKAEMVLPGWDPHTHIQIAYKDLPTDLLAAARGYETYRCHVYANVGWEGGPDGLVFRNWELGGKQIEDWTDEERRAIEGYK